MQRITVLKYLETLNVKRIEALVWTFATDIIVSLVLYVLAKLVIRIGTRMISNLLSHRHVRFDPRRSSTLAATLTNILRYVVYFALAIMILERFGAPVTTLLTGAGIAGVAIGFGAQSLVKDVITGFFILFEDQFAVGDEVMTGTYRGVVQEIGLRLTKIRSWTGEVHYLPNGTIGQVTNFSKSNSLAVLDISVAYEEDIDRVCQVLGRVLQDARKDMPDIVAEPVVQGVQSLGTSEVVVRCIAECVPTLNFSVSRELRKRIKETFQREGIEIPYPRQVTIPYKAAERSQNVHAPQGDPGIDLEGDK